MKKILVLLSLFFALLFVNALPKLSMAGECDSLSGQAAIDCWDREKRQKQEELDKKKADEEKVKAEKGTVAQQLEWTRVVLAETESELLDKQSAIRNLDEARVKSQERRREKEEERALLIRKFYKRGRVSFFALFFSEGGFSATLSNWGQNRYFLKQQEGKIAELSKQVSSLNAILGVESEKKETLVGEVAGLEEKKGDLTVKKSSLEVLHVAIQEEIGRISSEIAGISARQQQLLAEKLGSFSTSVGEVPEPDDNPPPHFSGKAFAVFSFGAPHRVGMSQFGALGRARSGQNYRDILGVYYANTRVEKRGDLAPNIEVYGIGRIPFEENYLRGIAEMPTKWADEGGFEALKAQAVAARTYAIAATGNGASGICAGEACQVYNAGKAASGADQWYRAVDETRGEILVSGDTGQAITSWYSSTTGGYTMSSAAVWGKPTSWAIGLKDVASGGSWPADAYEGVKWGKSPWFYKAWYHPRYVNPSRPSAWLNEEEFADILNCSWLYTLDNGVVSHLSQIDKGNGDTWSKEQVRAELQNRGASPVASITDVTDTTFSDGGFTLSVNIVTDQGMRSFSGGDFRAIFNLRAPGELFCPSSLFSIEER